jgi:RNA polymerase sigma factor (sigma-70 family)
MTTARLAPQTLCDLVAAAREGDAEAFGRLVVQYEVLVRNTAVRWGAGPDTEDLVQETWLRLWQHLGGLRQPAALPAWLCRTVRNLCHSRARRLNKVRFTPLEPDQSGEVAVVETLDPCAEEVVAVNEAQVLHRALGRLSPRDRQLAHHVMDQSTYGEISVLLEMPMGSIGPTRERMLRRLAAVKEVRHLQLEAA